jgi:DNA-directed RNA polymerase subunit RPC12/RpoP
MILRTSYQTRKSAPTSCTACGHRIKKGQRYASVVRFCEIGADPPSTAHVCSKCAKKIEFFILYDAPGEARCAREAVYQAVEWADEQAAQNAAVSDDDN